MIIKLATTNKRTNSTYIPTSWRDVYVHLKEGSNVINPKFILSASKMITKLDTTKESTEDNAVIRNYNYVYVPAFRRYYYITNFNIVSEDVMEISCTVDVLASGKADIKASNCVFIRTPFTNDSVLEETIPLSKYETVSKNTTALWSDLTAIGVYIDVAGKATASCNPTTSTYLISISGLQQLMAKVFDSQTYAPAGETAQTMDLISQTICNPSQYIVGCRVGRVNTHGSAVSKINFGWMEVPVSGAYAVQSGNYVYKLNRSISFPNYSNDNTKAYMLYIPCFGVVKLNPNDASGTINVEVDIDMHDGSGFCYVTNSKGKLIYSASGECMVNMPITGVTNKALNLQNGIMAGVLNFAQQLESNSIQQNIAVADRVMQGEIVSASEMAFSTPAVEPSKSIQTGINASMEKSVHTIGGSGTLAELLAHGYIEAYTLTNSRLVSSNGQGHPNYYYGKITDNGYYKATHVELRSNLYVSERSSIVNFLQSGIYFD